MKIATYFMKLCGAGLIAICGLVMFISALAATYSSVSDAFWGLAVMSAGVVILAYVLETSSCPIKLTISKAEQKAPATDLADTTTVPAISAAGEEISASEASVETKSVEQGQA